MCLMLYFSRRFPYLDLPALLFNSCFLLSFFFLFLRALLFLESSFFKKKNPVFVSSDVKFSVFRGY